MFGMLFANCTSAIASVQRGNVLGAHTLRPIMRPYSIIVYLWGEIFVYRKYIMYVMEKTRFYFMFFYCVSIVVLDRIPTSGAL